MTFVAKTNSTRPGTLFVEQEFEIRNVFNKAVKQKLTVEFVPLYNDENLLLYYSCTPLRNFWYTDVEDSFYLLKKNRNFDSFSKILTALEALRNVHVDLNYLNVVKNDQTCTN